MKSNPVALRRRLEINAAMTSTLTVEIIVSRQTISCILINGEKIAHFDWCRLVYPIYHILRVSIYLFNISR
jgi:hypothetical protein